jgi:DNA-binding transcriptional ArsR family regulator
MEIGDPKAIKALAHPLRLDLIELLGTLSPVTAARCGRILGVSQANCSFHLRQLARYGLVEEAESTGDRRERLWQLTTRRLSFTAGRGSDATVTRQLAQVMTKRESERILAYLDRRPDEPEQWQQADLLTTVTLPLSAAELAEIKAGWKDLIAPYLAKAEAEDMKPLAGQRHVRFFLAAAPQPELETGDENDEAAL